MGRQEREMERKREIDRETERQTDRETENRDSKIDRMSDNEIKLRLFSNLFIFHKKAVRPTANNHKFLEWKRFHCFNRCR